MAKKSTWRIIEDSVPQYQFAGPVGSIVEKLPKAQAGTQLPVNPVTGMPVVNLPEVDITTSSPWLERHLRQLSKREDGITQLGFSDPVTIAAGAAAGIPALGIAGARQLIGAIPEALNANVANIPGASINNFLNAAGITLSGSQIIDPNSAFRQSVGEAVANPNINTLSNAGYETAFTGLGFVGMPSSMTGPIKNSFEGLAKTASYVPARLAEKLPQYVNPNYARNVLKSNYPLITEESLNYIKPESSGLITNTITGLAAGMGAGIGQIMLSNDEITDQERAQYGKLARKKRDGTISSQEEAALKNLDAKVERIADSNAGTMLRSIGTGALFGLGLGIHARNREYFKNFMYAANQLPAREESVMATADPARFTRLLEARNQYWLNQNPNNYATIIDPDSRALLNRYGRGTDPYLPPPPPDTDWFGLNTGYVSGSYQPDYGTPSFINLRRNETPRFNLSRNEIANYVSNYDSNQFPITSYQPINKNISQVSKDDIIPFINDNSKQKLTQLTDDEFKNTVAKPSGNLEDYDNSFNVSSHFSGDNAIIQQSAIDWVDDFNSRVDNLNDIIQANNKSDINYRVTKLELEGNDYGKIFFETPAQTLPDGTKIPQSTSWFNVKINPGEWRGTVQDINNKDYFQAIPGLEMSGTTQSVFGTPIWNNLKDEQKRTGIYRSLNEFMKKYDKGRVKPGFNSQTPSSLGAWKTFMNKGDAVGYYGRLDPNASWHVLYGIMKKPGGVVSPAKAQKGKGIPSKSRHHAHSIGSRFNSQYDDRDNPYVNIGNPKSMAEYERLLNLIYNPKPKPAEPTYNIIQHSEPIGPQNMEMPKLVDYIMTPYGKMSRDDYEKQFGTKVTERDLRVKKANGGKVTWQIID